MQRDLFESRKAPLGACEPSNFLKCLANQLKRFTH